ncbi:PH domain-containing protein [Pedobacter endophyticus]|uniref:PH domain-containing protein n=1 Tax=Pedobacter endophyticus TaxID=2789740 RepID=A0A7S9L1K9_9SPHI|nr:PH domain-containing protein [Pedobacter endophyticus]QPH40830.1 PH domain-containing protein [Pedobacter endophyticus]
MSAETFTNEAIDIDALPKYEEILLNKPHRDYLKIIFIGFTIYFVVFGVAVGLGVTFIDELKPHALLIFLVYVGFMALLILLLVAGFKKRGYAIRTKDVIYKSGIIAESTTIVPLNRIQHIELNEGVFSRMFKVGTLQLFSAGGQSGHLNIAGIPIEQAKGIRDLLLKQLEGLDNQPTDL